MKFFIITVNQGTTAAQRDAVTSFFTVRKTDFGFWHWTPDFWIISTTHDGVTSVWLRDQLRAISPKMEFAVFGAAPRAEDWAMNARPQWADWIREYWR